MHASPCIHACCKPALLAVQKLSFMCVRTAVDGCAVILLHRERRSVPDSQTAGRAFLSCQRSLLGWGDMNQAHWIPGVLPQSLKQLAALWNTLTQPTSPSNLQHKHTQSTPTFRASFKCCVLSVLWWMCSVCFTSFLSLGSGLLCSRSGRGFIMPKRRMETAFSKMWRSHL